MTLSHFVTGMIMAVLGVLMVKYSFWLLNTTGPQEWLERFTGGGSTNGMYKVFGVLLVVLGLLWATGFGNNVIEFLFSPLKSIFRPLG